LTTVKGGLREVYRTLELPGKHALKDAQTELDRAVVRAYGFAAEEDLLASLLDLNRGVAERVKSKSPVCAPGIPCNYPDIAQLISDDRLLVENNLQGVRQ
jgi:hypothetical protein